MAKGKPNASVAGKSQIVKLNQDWLFGGEYKQEYIDPDFDDSSFENISIPHCVTSLSWKDWDVNSWQKVYGYRKHFVLPQLDKKARVILHFDGVMVSATPYINGKELPTHKGGYLPFEYDITDFVKENNVLTVAVDSRWQNVPPQGSEDGPKRIDYLEPGGIHRDVYIEIVPHVYVKDIYCKAENILSDNRSLNVICEINANEPASEEVYVEAALLDNGVPIKRTNKKIQINNRDVEINLSLDNLDRITLWDVNNPKLYDVSVSISNEGHELIYSKSTRFGFRQIEFKLDGFYLNGQRLQLFGLNRHELYPYFGYAAPDRAKRRDAEIIKKDFNCNIVRCSHYPQSEAFLDACDELGLLVWEEVPGWGYIGNEEWKRLLVRDVHDMIVRDRNHPSIIIWGTRVNESKSDVELYKETRKIAHELDDSRPTSGSMTSGTRKTWEKDWSQDVFAFDDYHADANGDVGIEDPVDGYPYMLAEVVGQFNYSARKNFNCFYYRNNDLKTLESQALRHAQAHSKAKANPRNSGVIGWCAFDYGSLVNSYHVVKTPGVADVFRIPKLGATFYMAQCDPSEKVVIYPNFFWDFSDKSPNGPGENVAIFSNCDKLKVYIDNKFYKELTPDSLNFKWIKYPPFFIDLLFENSYKPKELKIEGYINNRKSIVKKYSSERKDDKLLLLADDNSIKGDGIDATRVIFGITDKYGEMRPSSNETIKFDLNGPGKIIGDNPFDLSENGGCGAIWVKSNGKAQGKIRLKAISDASRSKTITIKVRD